MSACMLSMSGHPRLLALVATALIIAAIAASSVLSFAADAASESAPSRVLPVQGEGALAFLPLRTLAEHGVEVSWWPETRTAVVRAQGRLVLLTPRSDTAWTAERIVKLSARPFLDRGRLMVPAEDAARLLGMDVKSISTAPTIVIEGKPGAVATCPHCGAEFPDEAELHQHLATQLYACIRYPDCEFMAPTTAAVIQHYKSQPEGRVEIIEIRGVRLPTTEGAGKCRSEAAKGSRGWRVKIIPAPGCKNRNDRNTWTADNFQG